MIAPDSFSLNAPQNDQLDDVTGDDGIPASPPPPITPEVVHLKLSPTKENNFVLLPQYECFHLHLWESFAYCSQLLIVV